MFKCTRTLCSEPNPHGVCSLEAALLQSSGSDNCVRAVLRECTPPLTLPTVKSVMETLMAAGATRHVLAVFDALPDLGLEADTATMNIALTTFDIRAPLTNPRRSALALAAVFIFV